MRFPILPDNDTRDVSRTKDAWGTNCFWEKGEDETPRMVKRPGIITAIPTVGTVGQGLGNWNFNYVSVVNDILFVYSSTQLPCVLPMRTLTGSAGTVSLGQSGCGAGSGGVVSGTSLGTGSSALYNPNTDYPIDTPVLAQDPLTGTITTYYSNSAQARVAAPGSSGTPGLLWRKTPASTGHVWGYTNSPTRGNSPEAAIAADLCTDFLVSNPTAFVIYSSGSTGTLVYTIPGNPGGPFLQFNFGVNIPIQLS